MILWVFSAQEQLRSWVLVGLFIKLGVSFSSSSSFLFSSSSSCEFILHSLTSRVPFIWFIWPKYRVLSELHHSTLFHRSGQLVAEQWNMIEKKVIWIPCPHTTQQGILSLVSIPKEGISLGAYASIALKNAAALPRLVLGQWWERKEEKIEDSLHNLEFTESIFPLIFCPRFGDHDHYNMLGLACPHFKRRR